jgi:flagellar basal body P-ring formation protein FlgA
MLPLPLFLIAVQSAAPIHEDLVALEARLVAVVGAGIGTPGGPAHGIDRRLRLYRCPVPAEIQTGRGGVIAACPSLGWRVHVAVPGVAAGNATANDPAIRRGDAVLVRTRGRGFSVLVRAIALQDGAVGERIRLRRTSGSAAPIIAIVSAPGEATPVT